MISFDIQNLKSLKGIGIEIAGIGITLSADPKAARDLPLPFQSPVPGAGETGLLSWRANLSEFYGRDAEIALLDDWAKDDQYRCWIKFITADGGHGKSRLAAEFAKRLRGRGWSAGFLNLSEPQAFPLGKVGTLIIIDYPEENRDGVKALFKDLASVAWPSKVRVLLVTRGNVGDWDDAIQSGNAHPIVDRRPISLRPIADNDLFRQFESALANAKKCLNSPASPLTEEAFSAWLRLDPEINRRPLFVVALALYSALNPDDDVVKYSGKDVVRALAQREIDRLVRIAWGQELENKYAWAQILAMANIADSISVDEIEKFAADKVLDLSLPTGRTLRELLANSTILVDGKVPAMKPDIVAAAFTVEAFAKADKVAPELIWAAMQSDIPGCFDRLGRLAYDSEITLGILNDRLGFSFAKSLDGRADRASLVDDQFNRAKVSISMRDAALVSCQSLVYSEDDESEKARYLSNLSSRLGDLGRRDESLPAILEAVTIRRRLAKGNPRAFEPDLAVVLNNLANRYRSLGRRYEALSAIEEAVTIRRRLAEGNLRAFEPDLAMSLSNKATMLSDLGRHGEALSEIQEAAKINRRLAKELPQAFDPLLATVLNNMATMYSYLGMRDEALSAILEAVLIYRRLAEETPQAFEPDLAMSLSNLTTVFDNLGRRQEALIAIQEAVLIWRRLAEGNPRAFEPDLAMSVNNLATSLSSLGRIEEAVTSIQEAVAIRRRLAEGNPRTFEPDLAMSLNNQATLLVALDRMEEALWAVQEAIVVYRPLSMENPRAFEPKLATALNNQAAMFDKLGRLEEAQSAIEEAVTIRRQLTREHQMAYAEDLAVSLGVLGRVHAQSGRKLEARSCFEEAISFVQPIAMQYQESRAAKTLVLLQELKSTQS